MLRAVKLYGSLAIDAGVDSLRLDVNNTALLLRGLECAFPGFKKLTENYKNLVVVGTDKNNRKMKASPTANILEPFGQCDTIHVMPSVEGDITTAFYAVAEFALEEGVTSVAVAEVIAAVVVIVSLVAVQYGLSKVAEALAPKPKASSGGNDSSFIFSGPTQTVAQGGPIPIVYGTALVGSTIIASNYIVTDIPVGSPDGSANNTYGNSPGYK